MKKAFRWMLVKRSHSRFAWSVFPARGGLWVIEHFGLPFGSIAANHAWHRTGSLMRWIVRQKFPAPIARFVDDYFGISREAVYWHGGRCVEVLHSLIGIPPDPKKSCEDLARNVVLGSEVMLNWMDKQLQTR